MIHKVYYGEYTLQHWLDLLLSEDIILPKYQRYFVWDISMVKNIIANIKKDYFVPPVIIGQFSDNGQTKNLILDGQQRLTSLLLAKLGKYPNKDEFVANLRMVMDENDDIEDIDEELDESEKSEDYTAIFQWTYRELTEGRKTIDEVSADLDSKQYLQTDYQVDDQFFNNHFLGFCYLVPNNANGVEQQKYFSTLFRSINAQGVALLNQESREALYYLDANKAEFFRPSFIESINIKVKKGIAHIDYARMLALLANLKNRNNRYKEVAQGLKKDFEPYYEEFIQSVVSDDDNEKFGKFSELIPTVELEGRMEKLKHHIEALKFRERTYSSIIPLDVDFFGLVYFVIFEGKDLDLSRKEGLKSQLQRKSDIFRKSVKHAKSPSGVGYIRARMKDSINIYRHYIL